MNFNIKEANMTLAEKNKLFEQLVFVHQALTQKNQYFVSEFDIAKDAIVTITSMANDIKKQIEDETPKSEEVLNEPSQAV